MNGCTHAKLALLVTRESAYWRQESIDKLRNGDSRFTNQGQERALGRGIVVRDNEPTVRRWLTSKDEVAASLAVYFVSDSREGSHGTSARKRRAPAQSDTSTNSSEIGG